MKHILLLIVLFIIGTFICTAHLFKGLWTFNFTSLVVTFKDIQEEWDRVVNNIKYNLKKHTKCI